MPVTTLIQRWEKPNPEDHLTETAKQVWLYLYNDYLNRRPPKTDYIEAQTIANDLNISIEDVDSVREELSEIRFVNSEHIHRYRDDADKIAHTYSGRLILIGPGIEAGTRYYRKLEEERKEWFRHPILVAVFTALLAILVAFTTARLATSDLDERVKQIEEQLQAKEG